MGYHRGVPTVYEATAVILSVFACRLALIAVGYWVDGYRDRRRRREWEMED